MSSRDVFSESQWADVAQLPFVAGFAVTAADPGGLIGAVQESAALARVLQSHESKAAEGSLVHSIVTEIKDKEGRTAIKSGIKALIKGRKPAEASEAAVAQVKETMALVALLAPSEVAAVTSLVRDTARTVAEAASEGGFLGFGGEQVSESERKTLSEIDAALTV
jgi:hypothetical protein